MKDFREITLTSIAGKVYNKMLLNRIYDPIDNIGKVKILYIYIYIYRKH